MTGKLLVKRRKKLLPELTTEIPANGIITVGNDSSSTIELAGEKIAPEQFVIVCENDSMTLLCRVDGTSVNGEKLPQGALHSLRFGDEIAVSGYVLMAETEVVNGNGAARRINQETGPETTPETSPETAAETETVKSSAMLPETESETSQVDGSKSLTDVLDQLRAEERFYFLINNEERVYVESDDMTLGWADADRYVITTDAPSVSSIRANIRKDWSGVVLYPVKPAQIRVNGEALTVPRRLRNDDEIELTMKDSAKFSPVRIRFHEPTALLILDEILPKELPPPILLDDSAAADAGPREIDESDLIHDTAVPASQKVAVKGNIFGYFSITEIIIMAIGTLIGAAVIFLILEWF